MSHYVILVNFTDQGLRTMARLKDTTTLVKRFQAKAGLAGVKLSEIYWTMGRYDGVLVMEAPDDATISTGLLTMCSVGNVRTETLRAFSPKQMEHILEGLPYEAGNSIPKEL